jgi:hypothetical protein
MATTQNTYTGNGTNKLFSITFPYLDTADIDVFLNGTLQTVTTQYFFANATTVEFVTAPANGATVLLSRSTDDAALQATFFPGSSIKAADLNYNFDQVLYLAQETANGAANQSTAGLQAQITTATNTANNAITTANAATATANGIAGTANTALSNSSAAVTTANAASVTANNANTTANAISATASSAVTTANTAQTTANTAQTTANTAQTTANAALPKAGGTMTGNVTFTNTQPQVCKAWVNFNGSGTVAIRASFNVSSITDNGTGNYTVNFTTAMVDANFATTGTAGQSSTDAARYLGMFNSNTTTSTRIICAYPPNSQAYDVEIACVAIFR